MVPKSGPLRPALLNLTSSFWNKIRSDFPITKKCIYLDHAAGGPIPLPVQRRVDHYYQENIGEADFAWMKWVKRREEVRKKAADFIGADPSEITFIQSTSQGMNFISEMLVQEGSVATNLSEFPSSTLPWIWRKAGIHFQKSVEEKIPAATKTILTSFVQYGTGYRHDLEGLGKNKGSRYLVVNATQGFGAFPIDVEKSRIDFLCTNSYKWLMAGYGGGILYIRKKWLSKFKPSFVGWRSMNFPERMNNRKIDLKKEASRYELGCPPFPAIFAVGAAIDYLSGIGMEKIQDRILKLTDFAIENLEKKGFEILSSQEKKRRSGIVILKVKNPERVWKKLLHDKIYVSVRGGGIRLAPHFYNSFDEIEIFLRKLIRHSEPRRGRRI